MRSENMAKIASNFARSPRFQPFYMKLTSLQTMVIANFGHEMEVPPFLYICRPNDTKCSAIAERPALCCVSVENVVLLLRK